MPLLRIKNVLESKPVSLATVTDGNKPNVIGVAFVKVFDDHTVVVTDNYMNRTLKDLEANDNVCLLVWTDMLQGYKLIGNATYHTDGKWLKYVQDLEENQGLPAKGAVVVTITKVIASQ